MNTTNWDSWLNPPDIEPMMVECDNDRCSRGEVSWEDIVEDAWGNNVCIWCENAGYKSADQINGECVLNDPEIEKRTVKLPLDDFMFAGYYGCPTCGDNADTEIHLLNYVERVGAKVTHVVACHECNQLFWVTPEAE